MDLQVIDCIRPVADFPGFIFSAIYVFIEYVSGLIEFKFLGKAELMIGSTIILPDNGDGPSAMLPTDIISLMRTDRPMSTPEMDLVQMTQYKRLVSLHWPDMAFEIESQRERPDFIILRGGQQWGVDMVALTSTSRKAASAQFWQLKERLRCAYQQGRLRQCAGLQFGLRFQGNKVPPARMMENAIDELASIFEKFSVTEECLRHLDDPDSVMKAQPFPLGQRGSTVCGKIHWEVAGLFRIHPSHPQDSFMRDCKFSVVHWFTDNINCEELAATFDRLIGNHDKEESQGIDELVIIAGGPDKYGDAVTSEATLASLYREWKPQVTAPKFIKRIVLLDWATSSLEVVFGEFGRRKSGWRSSDLKWKFSPNLLHFKNKT
jgi:hypothetical protein